MEDKKEDDEKMYECKVCNFTSKYQSSLINHKKTQKHKDNLAGIVKEPIIHKCNKCNYESNHLPNMRIHILRFHSTEEEREKSFKYYCKQCSFGTNAQGDMTSHKKSIKHNRRCA